MVFFWMLAFPGVTKRHGNHLTKPSARGVVVILEEATDENSSKKIAYPVPLRVSNSSNKNHQDIIHYHALSRKSCEIIQNILNCLKWMRCELSSHCRSITSWVFFTDGSRKPIEVPISALEAAAKIPDPIDCSTTSCPHSGPTQVLDDRQVRVLS